LSGCDVSTPGVGFNEAVDGPQLTFRAITRADFGLIGRWLAEPQVWRWWHDDPAPEAVEAQYGATVDGTDRTQVFIVGLGGTPVGLLQRYCLDDEPQFRPELAAVCEVPPAALSMDYFISEAVRRGHGLGTRMIAAAVESSWASYPKAPAVIVPVIVANRPSWRALERAGFRQVARGPMTPDNPIDPPEHLIYRIDRPNAG
jgi:aminoglycoside 6'-N-acetyltransferase